MELSFLVINKLFGRKKEKCYIIKEVWENEEYRNGKYAKEKLAHWQEMIDNGTAEIVSIYRLYDIINKTIDEKALIYLVPTMLLLTLMQYTKLIIDTELTKEKTTKQATN